MSRQISVSKKKKIRGQSNLKVGLYYKNLITWDIVKVLKVDSWKEIVSFRYIGFGRYEDGTVPTHSSNFKFFRHYFVSYPLLKGLFIDITRK